ncbi:hypothetical protein SEA_HITTER_55 [Gordonia phage Hitter]|nr:hypothetical protein SEA_BARCO_53 [Gordonia phage Barco]QDK02268.1 hypothetical protein SEA_SAMBA_54 [Gordonia phage Samba]QNJ57952.1 hypothetical protein SEA_HITTER_55 [Gordonia phage Hitter]
MTVHIDTTADLEVGFSGGEEWTSVAAARHGAITPIDLDDLKDDRGIRIRFTADLGPFADTAQVIVPFTDLAEFVDQVRDGDVDGFEDALDHLPPRGRSRKYVDAYTLGQVEARGRAE